MNNLKSLIVLFASAFLLSACGGDSSPSSEPSPTPKPTPAAPSIDIAATENTSPVLSQTGGSAQLTFKTNGDWTATSSDSWIKVSQTSGKAGTVTLTISASDNDSYDDRKGTVTISSGSVSKTINVSQVLDLQDYSVAASAQSLDFEVETNVSLSVAISEDASSWITQATTRALHTESLYFDIAPNPTKEGREGIITISGGSVSQTIKVKQDGYGNISFEDPEVKAICIKYWDTDGDGELSMDEAAAVTSIPLIEGTPIFAGMNLTADSHGGTKYIYYFDELQYFTSLEEIPEGMFYGQKELSKVTLPENLKSIGDYAFYCCESLINITIPNKVTSIGQEAFLLCKSLTSIDISSSVTSIGWRAFSMCYSLTNIDIPKGITTIAVGAFTQCYALVDVNIPSSVTSIETQAFSNCKSLPNIDIPSSVTSIGSGAFYGCQSLTSITIPEGVNYLEGETFSDCSNLISVKLPSSLESIKGFAGCNSLESIEIPNGVKTIGFMAFLDCANLSNIIISNSVTLIDEFAFSYCRSIESIIIPESITILGDRSFNGCDNLKSFTCLASNPPIINNTTIDTKDEKEIIFSDGWKGTIYVPANSLNQYKTADVWKQYADLIQPIPE